MQNIHWTTRIHHLEHSVLLLLSTLLFCSQLGKEGRSQQFISQQLQLCQAKLAQPTARPSIFALKKKDIPLSQASVFPETSRP